MNTLNVVDQSWGLSELSFDELKQIEGGFLPALIIAGKVILSAKAVNAIAAAGCAAGVAIGCMVYDKLYK